VVFDLEIKLLSDKDDTSSYNAVHFQIKRGEKVLDAIQAFITR